MFRRLGLGALIATAAIALAACSSGAATPTQAPPAASVPAASAPAAPASASATGSCTTGGAASGTTTEIKNFSFQSGLTVAAGGSITFTNADSAPHTVTMDDGSCDAGRIEPGASATITFATPGTYAFHCSIHPSMKGTVVVTG